MSEVPIADQQLVAASLIDPQAFTQIVEKYEAPMRRYVRRLGCTNESDVDDVLQEIFIKVFKNLNDYYPELKFSSWLYRIAHNETISFFRKERSRPGVLPMSSEDADVFFAQLADDKDFVELAGRRDEARIVRGLLDTLDPKYRDVLVLRFLEEKSYTEISDILRIPEGTVATLISRGKKVLRAALEEKDIRTL